MKSEFNKPKLKLTRLEYQRRAALPEFQESLGRILPKSSPFESKLLSLPSSMSYRESFQESLQDLRRTERLEVLKTRFRERCEEELQRIFLARPQTEMRIFFSNWKAIGGLTLSSDLLVDQGANLLDLDRDTIYGGTPSLDFLFLADVAVVSDGSIYELNHWSKARR